MEIDRKNIAFIIFLAVVGITIVLVISALGSSDKKEQPKEEKEEEKKEEQELMKNSDVEYLFETFSKLETDRDSLFITKNDYSKAKDLSNDEKLFVAFKTITYYDHMNIDCNNLSIKNTIPNNFICTKKSYGISKGIIMTRYYKLFKDDMNIQLNNILTYVYDPELSMYIYFDLDEEEQEYDMPSAKLKDAYLEDGKLIIKYSLDFSDSGNGYFYEDVTLTFKEEDNKYIFLTKKVSYS